MYRCRPISVCGNGQADGSAHSLGLVMDGGQLVAQEHFQSLDVVDFCVRDKVGVALVCTALEFRIDEHMNVVHDALNSVFDPVNSPMMSGYCGDMRPINRNLHKFGAIFGRFH